MSRSIQEWFADGPEATWLVNAVADLCRSTDGSPRRRSAVRLALGWFGVPLPLPQTLQEADGHFYVEQFLGLVFDFALDAEGAAVADLFELGDETVHAYGALA